MRPKKAFSMLSAVAALGVLMHTATHASEPPPPAFLQARGAEVVKVEPAPGGMKAYTVRKDEKQGVFFVSPDGRVAIIGVMFDSTSGQNLSDALQPLQTTDTSAVAPITAAPSQPLPTRAELDKDFKMQAMTEHVMAIKKLGNTGDGKAIAGYMLSEKMSGVLEGKPAKAEDTAYVFFDPQCTYCHNLYHATRPHVKKGKAIKWIPVNTLGADGVPISKQVLQEGAKALEGMSNGKLAGIPASSADRAMVERNTAFLVLVLGQMKQQIRTPTVFFVNPTTSKLILVQDDGSNVKALEDAFGKGK